MIENKIFNTNIDLEQICKHSSEKENKQVQQKENLLNICNQNIFLKRRNMRE